MSQDDPRLIPFNLLDRIRAAYQDRWPKPGEELILLLGGSAPPPAGDRRDGAAASRVGDGAGALRRPEGDDHRAVSRPQPVWRSAGGADAEGDSSSCCDRATRRCGSWACSRKAKTFNFDPGKRIDTGRWVKVQGTVHSAQGADLARWHEHRSRAAPEETTEVADRSAAATAGGDPVHGADRGRGRRAARPSASGCSCRAISIRRR